MTSKDLREKFLKFFEEKGHKRISSASLIPENDPSVLFTTAGMHPLVPYIMGEDHPKGKKLANSQKCIRTGDIDEVGDKVHHTFFEMLGNWSFGDYFKEEAIDFSYEFLTDKKWLGLDKDKLAMSVFKGDSDAPFDKESYDKWISLGISEGRIAKLEKKDNWWGPAGETGPCGPDTEMFYWSGKEKAPEKFDPKDDRWVEIWNDVFMEYEKTPDNKFKPLEQKNVDTGMGLERTLSVLNGLDDDYQTDLFLPIIQKIEEVSGKKYEGNEKEFRVIADHIKAAIFAIDDGVMPSNKQAGYIVRRLVRRAVVKGQQIEIKKNFTVDMVDVIQEIYQDVYKLKTDIIKKELQEEEKKFRKTLNQGLKQLEKITKTYKGLPEKGDVIGGWILFDLYQSYGFPLEISLEELERNKIPFNKEEILKDFKKQFKKHQELSRTASAGMFKGGLADASEMTVKYHTAAHLLLAALQDVLGEHVHQKGSNITAERLRLDYSHADKLTDEEKKNVEDWVNDKIEKKLEVHMDECDLDTAKRKGAEGEFTDKYGDKVKVYSIGGDLDSDSAVSKEICGGPHIKNTSELGHFKIKKEQSSSKGVRRIKAVLE